MSGWSFERDEDALVLQAKGGLPDDMEALYVGCLPVEIEGHEQEVRAAAGRARGARMRQRPRRERAVGAAAAAVDGRRINCRPRGPVG